MGVGDLGRVLVIGFMDHLGVALVSVDDEVDDIAVVGFLGAVAVDVVLEVHIGDWCAGLVLHRSAEFISRIVGERGVITVGGFR